MYSTPLPYDDLPPTDPSQGVAIDLDEPGAVQAACAKARSLQPHCPAVRVDCHQLSCQRTLGVSHVISQLLLLRRAGAEVWLARVNAPLQRCLQLLHLTPLFYFGEPE
jgi:hypothetical protein